MSNILKVHPGDYRRFPAPTHPTPITDELNRIARLLRAEIPRNATISFEFIRELRVHIDLAKREDVSSVENLLPNLGAGLFHSLSRGATPRRTFFHRVSALVNS